MQPYRTKIIDGNECIWLPISQWQVGDGVYLLHEFQLSTVVKISKDDDGGYAVWFDGDRFMHSSCDDWFWVLN